MAAAVSGPAIEPDRHWEPAGPSAAQPDAVAVERETIELAFLAAIQHLPPRQRAVLILRDVLGWPAKQTATLLDGSVASVNSALQRARTTLKEHLPRTPPGLGAVGRPTEQERAVLRRYMDAVERADLDAVAKLLAEDVRTTMPPFPMWFQGRDAVLGSLAASWDPKSPALRGPVSHGADRRQPPAGRAAYVRQPRTKPSTAPSRSACCGSRAGASRRSPPSTTPACSRRLICQRRCPRPADEFSARSAVSTRISHIDLTEVAQWARCCIR